MVVLSSLDNTRVLQFNNRYKYIAYVKLPLRHRINVISCNGLHVDSIISMGSLHGQLSSLSKNQYFLLAKDDIAGIYSVHKHAPLICACMCHCHSQTGGPPAVVKLQVP